MDLDHTVDAFLGGQVSLIQPKKGYRAGLDAVFLGASVSDTAGSRGELQTLLDLGAGVGTAGLCAAHRCQNLSVVLFERAPLLAEMAEKNVLSNGLQSRARVVAGDVETVSVEELAAHGLHADGFDHVIANPPFYRDGAGTRAETVLKADAHAMAAGGLDVWCKFMARMACSGGTGTLIHRADALDAILATFGRRFGRLRVLPLYPRADEPAIRVIVQGIKGSKAPLSLLSGIILHDSNNQPTPAARRVLRDGAALDLDALARS